MKKTNFDLYLEQQLKDSRFAERFKRAGIAWDVTGDGTNVVRGSYGLYFVQQIKNTYYQRNYLEKSTIFFSSAPGILSPPPFGFIHFQKCV